jgi:hypothetical protein
VELGRLPCSRSPIRTHGFAVGWPLIVPCVFVWGILPPLPGELFTFLGRQCTPVVAQNRAAIVASCLAFLRSMIDKSGVGKEIRIVEDGKGASAGVAPSVSGGSAAGMGGGAGASVDGASAGPTGAGDKPAERSPKRKGIPDVANRPASGQYANRRVSFVAGGKDLDETGAVTPPFLQHQ